MTGIFTWIALTSANTTRAKIGHSAGWINNEGYIHLELLGKAYKCHRLAWLYMTGEFPKLLIDHINRIKSDNRWLNLREATHSQNKINQSLRPDNTSGFKGVSFNKSTKKWMAYATLNKKKVYLGLHETAEAAHKAYLEFSKVNYGEFIAT